MQGSYKNNGLPKAILYETVPEIFTLQSESKIIFHFSKSKSGWIYDPINIIWDLYVLDIARFEGVDGTTIL